MNKISINQPKALFNPQAKFIEELEIMKYKLEIKPRKVKMMDSQVSMLEDAMAEVEARRKYYVPNNKGGFIK